MPSGAAEISPTRAILPVQAIAFQSRDPNLEALAKRISSLEGERASLIKQFSEQSVDLFNPRSELSALLADLKSQADDDKLAATVKTLMQLRDPLSFSEMRDFFMRDQKRATAGYFPNVVEWYDFFINTDRAAGFDLVIGELASENPLNSGAAHALLSRRDPSDFDTLDKSLKVFAVGGASPSARARAKVLLKEIAFRRSELAARQAEDEKYKAQLAAKNNEPSIRQLLVDLNSKVDSLIKSSH